MSNSGVCRGPWGLEALKEDSTWGPVSSGRQEGRQREEWAGGERRWVVGSWFQRTEPTRVWFAAHAQQPGGGGGERQTMPGRVARSRPPGRVDRGGNGSMSRENAGGPPHCRSPGAAGREAPEGGQGDRSLAPSWGVAPEDR